MDQWVRLFLAEDKAGADAATWLQFKEQIVNYVSNPDVWMNYLFIVIKVIVIYTAARLVTKFADKTLQHMLAGREKSPLKFDTRRTKTIGKLIGNITTYVVNFIMILMILNQFGIRLEPLLAGAGVVGLAVGFGAQSLVKDVITGFFIIFEDQFAVGDVIQTGNFKGTVEEIGLRVTRIKSWTGEVHIIPNGTITQVTNFSVNNSVAVVDVSVAYEEDVDKALAVMRETVLQNYETNVNMVKAPEVLGVQSLAGVNITLRVTVECKPNMQFAVARELYAEIKKAFDSHGIEVPYQRVVNFHKNERGE
ncbi:mechanosensitive ion channel family protein [Paenibacillus doosanensis]|uniref:mechanosensitive ion channel family protein n=1 Tax=Paenibacillus doosanensis TaxID=1229154 RepID=UPI00218087B3|nr:mechanosensitive ion channel family protein [Paenibacillus doosanensis]MCS7463102.1 mechanosensitive ion channel family protein [Paenibacillus doosanensis]